MWSVVDACLWSSVLGAFLVSVGVVALGEMSDKTQIATAALAARYSDTAAVVAGTTLGMMLANVPASSSATASRGRCRCSWCMRSSPCWAR